MPMYSLAAPPPPTLPVQKIPHVSICEHQALPGYLEPTGEGSSSTFSQNCLDPSQGMRQLWHCGAHLVTVGHGSCRLCLIEMELGLQALSTGALLSPACVHRTFGCTMIDEVLTQLVTFGSDGRQLQPRTNPSVLTRIVGDCPGLH